MDSTLLWVGFNVFVLAMLALDLGVFHRKAHEVNVKEALVWSVVWIGLALVFNVVIYLYWDVMMPNNPDFANNTEAALAFLTGYLIEKSLSVDNIFVFVLVFTSFAVPAIYQHRVLFWGVLGALIMRGIMIAAGAALIKEFHWIIWIFGAFLIYTGIKMVKSDDHAVDPADHTVVKWLRKIMPMTDGYEGQRFVVVKNGVRMATPLLAVLLVVEFTDLIFAVDSIPAIFAITSDPFIVLTSNVFAILGLRAMYFLLAAVANKFHLLNYGLAVILVFIGTKMCLIDVFKIPVGISLGVVVGILAATMLLSVRSAKA